MSQIAKAESTFRAVHRGADFFLGAMDSAWMLRSKPGMPCQR